MREAGEDGAEPPSLGKRDTAIYIFMKSFPFCQGLNNFSFPSVLLFDIKIYRAFYTAQIIIHAGRRIYK